MVVKKSFISSLIIVYNNPILLGASFILGLIEIPEYYFKIVRYESIWVDLYSLFTFLIFPFYLGGIYGMVKEAMDGRVTKLSTFIQEGKRNFARLLIVYVIFITLFIIIVIPAMFIAGFSSPIWSGVFLILFFLFQFFDVGVVINNYGKIETFIKSVLFVKERLVSVLKYSLLSFPIFISNTLILLYFVPNFFSSHPLSSYLITSLILGTISWTIMFTFHIVFYVQSYSNP